MQLTSVVECVGTDRGSGLHGRRSGNTAALPARSEADEGVPRRWMAGELGFRPAHKWMMASKRSKGNPDPSRWLASVAAGTAAGGPDGRAALRDSADADDSRSVSAGAALAGGRRDCNSAAHDHSRHTERTVHGIRCADKPVVAELLRQKPPCVFAGGTGQRLRLRVRLEPDCVWWPDEGCHTGTPAAPTAGGPPAPALDATLHPSCCC